MCLTDLNPARTRFYKQPRLRPFVKGDRKWLMRPMPDPEPGTFRGVRSPRAVEYSAYGGLAVARVGAFSRAIDAPHTADGLYTGKGRRDRRYGDSTELVHWHAAALANAVAPSYPLERIDRAFSPLVDGTLRIYSHPESHPQLFAFAPGVALPAILLLDNMAGANAVDACVMGERVYLRIRVGTNHRYTGLVAHRY